MRPTLGIAHPGQRNIAIEQRPIDLDGFFGLHPALAPLMTVWGAGHLAIVNACGLPDESRSHFRSQELMERAVSDESGPHLAGSAAAWTSSVMAIHRPCAPLALAKFHNAACAAASR